MLNGKEEILLEDISYLMTSFKQMAKARQIEYDLEPYDGDVVELAFIVHQLQNWVLANSAADEKPSEYRFYGCCPLRNNDD